MRSFLLRLCLVALLLALGFLGWRLLDLVRQNQELRETLALLEEEQRAAAADPAGPAEVESDTTGPAAGRELERQASELRGLSYTKPVEYRLMERRQLREFLVGKVREQFTEQELRDYQRSLAALGLIPEQTDLFEILVSMYDEQVAAFYDLPTHALYTFRDLAWSSGINRMLMVHELTHALQDQNYDLTRFGLDQKENDDRALAAAALIEGDATSLMTRWYATHMDPSRMWEDLAAMLGQNTARLRAAPPYLREMLLFPYLKGQSFVDSLLSEGGEAALVTAFQKPPVSTSQILHPEQYRAGEGIAEAVDLPTVVSDQWRRIGNNVLGEFGIRSLLQQELGVFQGQNAAEGWRGDRYHVYEQADQRTAFIWMTRWQSPGEAEEFARAYRQWLGQRSPSRQETTQLQVDGAGVTIVTSDDPTFFELLGKTEARSVMEPAVSGAVR